MIDKPLHIVFLSHEYPLWAPGGVGTFLQTFGRNLVRHGHEVTVLGAGKDKELVELEDQGVRLIRLPKNKGKLPNFIHNARWINKKLRQLQQEQPIDIIEGAEPKLALLSKGHKAKKVIRLHGGHHFFSEAENRGINWRKGLLEKLSFKKADGFVAVSNFVKEHTAKYLSYHGKPIEVIASPVDTSLEVKGLEVDPNMILFAGTVCEKKGIRQLIAAMDLVRERYPELQLHVFGRDWFFQDGRSYIDWLKEIHSPQTLEAIIFHGTIPRAVLNDKYEQAMVCVFPSHMETQGLVSLEALLLEKPVVFSKYGPGPEAIEHGVTGLLCDVYDPADIAAQIIRFLNEPDKAKEMGVAGNIRVREKYDQDRILQQNIDFYQRLIQ